MSPQIGFADSADFGRISSRIGLKALVENPGDRFFKYFNSTFEVVDKPKVPVNAAQVLPLISLGLNNVFHPGSYSIFYLSALYLILYLGGFYLLVRNLYQQMGAGIWAKLVLGLVSILVLSDIMFVAYFNSFYQEALFIVSALYAAAFMIGRSGNYHFLLITLVILSVSKAQNIIFLIFPLGIAIWKYKYLNKVLLGGIGFVLAFFLFFIVKEQAQTNEPNLYEAVFMGLMREADPPTQEKILKELGLKNKEYLKNVNKGFWRPNNEVIADPDLYREFYSEVSQGGIVKVYLNNPKIFFRTSISAVKELLKNPAQPNHLGNYSKEYSGGRGKVVVQSFWGQVLNYLFLPIYGVGVIASIFMVRRKLKNKSDWDNIELTILVLVLLIPILFSAIFVAGGINDFVKHNLPVYFLISILFLLLLFKLIYKSSKKDSNSILKTAN